ncbi:hypothetical protein [Agrobacterium rosae]|uniref:hypothetical protein n=1 Tax=Agrobacterium rosae TaxID=1972867 RepID=UPI00122F8CF5|nr:hypothetical protein [Agrobacterium rosae]KAA3507680.1 hypothetical protein DXM21_24485 [Agrobacterium rosae]KAA3512560.1 hypothetical protein DXM25_24675 [Agrobacterium rosae]MQB51265.1 hypothetical protein [Agrobacterium rosae]
MSDVVVVLGMHRSGTSSVAGTLVKLGGKAPANLMKDNAFNERGYFESATIAQFDDDILSSAGSRWDDWRAFDPKWYDSVVALEFRARARDVFAMEFATAPLPIMKDPRIGRFFPFWRQVFEDMGKKISIVMPLRSPWDVAKSLKHRDEMTMNYAVMLWLRYVLDAEAETRDLPRSIFSWQDFLGDWRSQCDTISAENGLTWPNVSDQSIADVENFLSRDLQHHVDARDGFSELRQTNQWAVDAYDALVELSQSGKSVSALATLSRIRHAFNEASDIFSPLLSDHEFSIQETKTTLATVRDERIALLNSEKEAADLHERSINEVKSALQQSEAGKRLLEKELSQRQFECEELRSRINMMASNLKKAQAERASLETETSRLLLEAEARERLSQAQLVNAAAALSASSTRIKNSFFGKLHILREDKKTAKQILQTDMFDLEYYAQQYRGPMQIHKSMEAILHYVTEGFSQGLRPNAFFDTQWYLAKNGDVRDSGLNPLLHYDISGWREGRDPSPEFSSSFYLDNNLDVRSSGVNPLQHFLRFGRAEGRLPRRPTGRE